MRPSVDSSTPWQVQWKKPQWTQSSTSKNDRTSEDDDIFIVGVSSAQISIRELPESLKTNIQGLNNLEDESSSPSILLSVTLLSPKANAVASEVLLELFLLPSTHLKESNKNDNKMLIASSRLQWPEAVFGQHLLEEDEKEINIYETDEDGERKIMACNPEKNTFFSALQDFLTFSPLMTQIERKKQEEIKRRSLHNNVTGTNGVLSTILLRRPRNNDPDKTSSDSEALDTIALMSLGMEAASLSSPVAGVAAVANQDVQQETSSEQSPPELYLACMTANGLVAIYSPWTLLRLNVESSPVADISTEEQRRQTPDDVFMNSLATLFLGQEIFSCLEKSWKPLSQPLATISLSVLEQNHVDQNNMSKHKPNRHKRALDVSLWNHLIDSATIPHRTVMNRATKLAVAGSSYLVVIGSGIPFTQVYRDDDNSSTGERQTRHNHGLRQNDDSDSLDDWWGNQQVQNNIQKLQDDEVPKTPSSPNTTEIPTGVDSNGSEWFQEDGTSANRGPVTPSESKDSWYQDDTPRSVHKDETKMGGGNRWWNDGDSDTKSKSEKVKAMSAGHWWDNMDKKSKEIDKEDYMPADLPTGGFVTFCSTTQWSETRTLFLPFTPKQVSYIPQWHSMELLLVIGETQAMAVRMDSSSDPVLLGGTAEEGLRKVSLSEGGRVSSSPQNTASINPNFAWIRRFQVLPIPFPQTSVQGRLLCGSAMGVQPPALLQIFTEEETRHGLVLKKTMKRITSLGTIEVSHTPCHVAKIRVKDQESLDNAWSLLGQGWSILVTDLTVYFICWEGATSARGVNYFQELEGSPCLSSLVATNSNFVLPIHPTATTPSADHISLPFSTPYESAIQNDTSEVEIVAERNGHVGDIVVDALESISCLSYREQAGNADFCLSDIMPPSPRRRKTLSHREKGIRLLRQCSSWTQLEVTQDKIKEQVPVVNIRLGKLSDPHYILTLRQLVVQNGPASPFQEVLAWLSDQEDYFTAASIALDLLQDTDTLFHLWQNAEKIDEVDEQTKLEGLLDGIVPLDEDYFSEDKSNFNPTLVQLADMTVGCLIKGGLCMSKTLKKFLNQNKYYDPARACLMLAATTASALSEDPKAVAVDMGEDILNVSYDDLLWPVRCLLEIGVSRSYLSTALLLLNATIPDELRRRPQQHLNSPSIPTINLTEKLVTLIIACDKNATGLLLDLVDDISRCKFWLSLDHKTRLLLSLTDIEKRCPLLRHSEVRYWARDVLHACLKDEKSANANVGEMVPTDWLQKLCVACLYNAGCELKYVNVSKSPDDSRKYEDGLEQHKAEILETRNALISTPGSGGLDFDIIIPCLLLLQSRGVNWREKNETSTQSILDATCYLAGRPTNEEPIFAFDSATVMQQCALAGNVRAGANLIGGKDGFVLSCCDILINELDFSMDEAEAFFLESSLSLPLVELAPKSLDSFEVNDSHRQLLWLLDEHVLSIQTFGEFETIHIRGKVDPVFCARSILRAWFCLSSSDKDNGMSWLTSYLKKRLGIERDDLAPSPHRLACAALCRALLWTLDSSDQPLCVHLNIESNFLVQVAHSCCGLVESVPPVIAEEIMKKTKYDPNSGIQSGFIFANSIGL